MREQDLLKLIFKARQPWADETLSGQSRKIHAASELAPFRSRTARQCNPD
jgi:hypothetical protein